MKKPVQDGETQKIETETKVEMPPNAKPHYRSRAEQLKEIADDNRQAREEQQEGAQDDEVAAELAAEEKEEPQEQEAAQEQQPEETNTETVEATPPVEKHKLVIDGSERELTLDEVKALAQKAGAVDARLAEATRILEDAKRRSATHTDAQNYAATHQPNGQGNPPSAKPVADVENELIGQLSKAVMYGDETQVTEAFSKLLGKGRENSQLASHVATQTQGMSPREVQGFVLETLAFERGKQILESPPEQGGFSDVWNDPVLRSRFIQRDNELLDQCDSRPYSERYSEIGKEIRSWKEDLIKKHTPQTGLENRDQLKRSTGVVRGAGGKPPAPVESKPKTHEDKLEGIRRARGQN